MFPFSFAWPRVTFYENIPCELCDRRTLRVGRDLEVSCQAFCLRRVQREQVVWGCVCVSKDGEISLPLWAALPVFDRCRGESFFLYTTSDVPVFQLVSIAPCLSAVFWCLFVKSERG